MKLHYKLLPFLLSGIFAGVSLAPGFAQAQTPAATDTPSAEESAEKQIRAELSKAWDAKDWGQALKLVDALLQASPQDGELTRKKGFFLGELGRMTEAISAYRRSTELSPKDPDAWNGLCWKLIITRHPQEARPACERSVAIKKDYANTVNLGHTFLLAGDKDTAYQWYREALGLIESEKDLREGPLADFDLFVERGWHAEESRKARQWLNESYAPLEKAQDFQRQARSLRQAGKAREALPLAQQALAIREQHLGAEHAITGVSLDGLANLYKDMGDYDKALPLYQRALTISEKAEGPEHLSTGASLNNLAGLYRAMGDYAKALPLYQRALTISEKAEGPEHPSTGASLNNLAGLYEAMGDYAKALPLFQRALTISEKAEGPEHPSTGTRLNNLAALYERMGDYAKALPLFLRALTISEKAEGPEHPSTGNRMNNLAALYQDMGDYAKALPLFQRALTISEKAQGPEHPSTGNRMNNLAGLYRAMGDYAKALSLFQRALTISEKAEGPEHPSTGISLSSLALLYQDMGDYAKALPLYQRALTISEKAEGPEHPSTGTSLNNLAVLYDRMGDYAKALPLFQRALTISEKAEGPEHPSSGNSLNNLAVLYERMGDYAKALPLFQRALTISEKAEGPEHPSSGTYLNNLAALYRAMGDYAKALPLYQRALTISEKAEGPEHPSTGNRLNNLALLYQAMGDYAKALPLYQRALTISEKAEGPEHPSTGISLNNVAALYERMGGYAKALELYQRALTIFEKTQGPEHPSTGTSLKNLAVLYWRMSQPDQALPLFERYVSIIEKLRSQSGLGVESKQNLFAQYVDGYKQYAQLLGEQKMEGKAFTLFELSKARTLLEETAARAGRLALPEADAVALEALQRQLAVLNDQVAKAEKDAQRQTLLGQRDETGRQLDSLHQRLSSQYPKYAQLTTPKILEADAAARLLPADGVFVSYLENAGHLLALTMGSDAKLSYHDLGSPDGLSDALATYRAIVALPRGLAGLGATGQRAIQLASGEFKLWPTTEEMPEGAKKLTDLALLQDWLGEQLLVPLKDKLKDKRQWIISPDGALALLPFDTLRFEGEPVLQQHDISLAQSLSIYALLKQRSSEYQQVSRAKAVFGMGNPDFGGDAQTAPDTRSASSKRAISDSSNLADSVRLGVRAGNSDAIRQGYAALRAAQWAQLPGTAAELEGVRQTFGASQTDLYLADQATEAKLQSLNSSGKLRDYRYILFSTHGYLSTEVPALSAVVLGQKNLAAQTDGYVTAAEWPGYDLKSDLVVLSACETGVGKNVQGEGVMGLPFALYVAGNINTVLTLWQVDDEATAEFMRRFFARLKAGEDQVKALNAVKREFINNKEGLNNPAYWAPFVLYGV